MNPQQNGAEPEQRLLRLMVMSGPQVSQSLYVAAKLGIVDHLDAERPVDAERLAVHVDAHPQALYRFCRVLAALEVLVEHPDRTFTLGPLAGPLKSDHPASMRHAAVHHGEESYRAWAEVVHSVRTGEPAFDKAFGMPFFDYLASNPAAAASFNAMMGVTDPTPAVIDTYDFGAATVVDVGGGIGTLLAHVLATHEGARGVLFDLPEVVADAPAHLADLGVTDRCEVVGGSFFDGVPAGDVYVVSRVLHNWSDPDAVRLLANVRARIPLDGRLMVVDHLLADVPGFHPGKLADLHMLVLLGGRERTEEDFAALLGMAGFELVEVRTGPDAASNPRAESMLEARPV